MNEAKENHNESDASRHLNLVLIGMPGAGKSTLGAILARKTGRKLVELDDLVEARVGCSIPEYFARCGEAAFRRVESEIVRENADVHGVILVTGGGVVTREENREPLHRNGYVIEVMRPVEWLSRDGRPLSAGIDALRKMEVIRRPLYDAFRDGFIANVTTPEAAAEAAWACFLAGCEKA